VYKVLVRRHKGKGPPIKLRCRWEVGIRMDLRKLAGRSVEWIHLAQDRDWWWAVVSTVMNLCVLAPLC
jgi:hypothetical protein